MAGAGPSEPSGYDCGVDGKPEAHKGCTCSKDKIEIRREDNWASCVPRPVTKAVPVVVIPKVTAKESTKGLSSFERGCDAKKGQDCTTAGSMYALGQGASHNDTEARVRYQHACDYGDNGGCVDLGIMYEAIGEVEKAFTLYQTACVGKYPRGCTSLGVMYSWGRGVERNDERAFKLFFDACHQSNETQGCANLGIMYENGRGTQKDEKEAATIYRTACEGGAAESCTLLGMLLDTGRGVTEDVPRAIEMFTKGCTGNDPMGCQQLALANLHGHGVPQNDERGFKLFETACEHQAKTCSGLGDLYAQGRATTKNEPKAFELFDRACRANDPTGCARSAQAYVDGRGVAKDVARGAVLSRQACGGGIAAACTLLGTLDETTDAVHAKQAYEKGCDGGDGAGCTGLATLLDTSSQHDDHKRAAELYRRACDLGHTAGCNDLGVSYDDGRGVDVDPAKAATLFDGACKSNYLPACANLGLAYLHGRGVTPDPARAVPFLERACTAKIAPACTAIGFASETGLVGMKDLTKANASYAKGCSLGDARACMYQGLLEQDAHRAADMLKKTCDAKDELACTFLASLYSLREDLQAPIATIIDLYTNACSSGIAAACSDLGVLRELGRMGKADPEAIRAAYARGCDGADVFGCARLDTAYRTISNAGDPTPRRCDHGDVRACVTLGVELTASKVPGDLAKAYDLFKSACAAGAASGCRRMAEAYADNASSLPPNESERSYLEKACLLEDAASCIKIAARLDTASTELPKVEELYERACDAGNADACASVGLMYQNGRGVAADGLHAFVFYKQACDANSASACLHVAQMYQTGTVLHEDSDKASEYRKRACKLGSQAGCR